MRRPKPPEPVCLTERRASDKYPRIIVDRRNRPWLAWQRFADGRDVVVVTCLRDNMVVFQQAFSGFGCAYRPVLCEDAGGRIVVAWSEVSQAGADVFLSTISHGRRALPVKVSTGGKDLGPALAPDPDGGIWIAYHSFRRGKASVFLRRFASGWSDEIEVAPGMEAYRPAVVALGGGKARVYFDAFVEGRYGVYTVESDGADAGEPVRLSSGKTWCSTPVAVADGRGDAAVAWHGIGAGSYVCYDAAVDGRTERVASVECRYASHDVCADGDSVWLTWHGSKSEIVARRLDRKAQAWSAPAVVCGGPGAYRRRPTTAVDRSGAMWLAWQESPSNGKHLVRDSAVYLQRVRPDEMAALADASVPAHTWPSEAGHEIVASPEPPRLTTGDGKRVFFGDIHGHICLSDGLGTHDQFYNFERHVSRLDFGAVTDHCDFPDEMSVSEWNVTRLLASAFNEPGAFVTLLGYEWTSNEVQADYGHKNVYYPADAGQVLSPCREAGATPEALCAGAKRYGALVVPHHVSVDWGSVRASTDWSHHQPEVERLCEIASCHGAMEYDGNPRAHGNPPVPNCSVQSALARGYRLGLIASSDTHRLAPGRNGGIAAVVCDGLSREQVFGALWSRRCYASTGPRLLIEFSVAGHEMGEEVAPGEWREPVPVRYTVEVDRPVESIEIVKNNETAHRHEPGDSRSAGQWQDPARPTPGTYYYLRIGLEGGEFAWSSPVWLG